MSTKIRDRFGMHYLAAAAAVCCASLGAAQAQTQTPTQELDRVTVTGSNIRRIDAESALPVQVITASDIQASGKTSITEILQTLAANGGNGVTDAGSFSNFAYGASGVSLRGLGPTSTLVLINGRRVAPYSVPDINTGLTNFVNVDAIPRGAIQRIEILKDGASAIYGSDAMAGVINIILRNDYQGGEIEVNARANDDGKFGSQWAGLTYGRGDLDRDGWNWMATLDVYHRDGVMLSEVKDDVIDTRHRDSSFYYTGRANTNRYSPAPNYYSGVSVDPASGASFVNTRSGQASTNCPANSTWAFNPALNLCGYDYWNQAAQYVSPIQRQTLFSRGEFKLGSGTTAFGELALTRLSNKQRDWPVPFGAGLGATPNGRDGGVSYVPQFLPAGHPNNPYAGQPAGITYLFSDVGMQGIDVTNNTSRLLLGVRGTTKDWDWEVGVLNARDKAEVSYLNRISLPALRDAVLNGTYNFEKPGAGAVTAAQLRINPVDHGLSEFTAVDAKISGTVGSLPGGPIGVAAGVEARHERRYYTPDERIYAGEVYLQVAGRTEGSRNVVSAFSELSAPISKSLQAQLAVRADHYSDYGQSVTPKLAVAWKALDQLKFRGSASKGFRAPSLNESSSSNVPLFSYVDFDPKRCGTYNIDCDGYRNSGVISANKDLKPEKSTSYGLGMVVEPVRDVSLALDYWQIERRNEIVFVDQQSVIDNEGSSNPLYAGRVHRLPDDTLSVPGQSIPGRIATIDQLYLNRGRTQVRGVDVDARIVLRPAGMAPIRVGTSFTYMDRYREQAVSGEAWTVRSGSLGYPRLRGNVNVGWSPAAWSLNATLNYLSGFRATAANQQCSGDRYLGVCEVKSDVTLDLGAVYRWSPALTLRGTVLNVTDERMPFTPTEPTGNRYWYSAAGRMLSVSASYQF